MGNTNFYHISITLLLVTLFWIEPSAGQQLKTPPNITIQKAKEDKDHNFIPDRINDTITVSGRVNVSSEVFRKDRLQIAIQDQTAGIVVFSLTPNKEKITAGDSIQVTGILSQYRGLTQLTQPQIQIIDTINRKIPKPVTFKSNQQEELESKIVSLKCRIINKNGNRGGNYFIVSPIHGSDSVLMVYHSKYHADQSLLNRFKIGETLTVTGLLSQHDYTNKLNGFYSIMPRSANDIKIIGYTTGDYLLIISGIILFALIIGTFSIILQIKVRKKTKSLQDSEQRINQLLQTTSSAILIYQNGQLVFSNQQAKLFAGNMDTNYYYKAFEHISQNTDLSQDAFSRSELRLQHESKPPIWIDYSMSAVKWNEKDAIIVTAINITKRIKAKKEAIQNAKRFESLANSSTVGIFRTLPNGYTTYVNPKWYELSGLKTNALGDGWLNSVHPEDRDKLAEKWKIDSTQQNSSLATYRFLHEDGTIVWVVGQVNPEYDENNQLVGYIGSITDITQQKKAEEELLLSEKKYKYLFQHNPQPMWIYDLKSLAFLEVNETAILHYGYSREEFLKMTLKDIRPKEDLELLETDVLNTYVPFNKAGIWRHIKKDGTIIQVEIVSHEITYENKPSRLVLVNEITERIKAENNLRQSEKSLKEAEKLSNMGHWKYNFQNGQTSWSENCYRLYGLLPFELEPSFEYFKSRIHPDDHQLIDDAYNKILTTKKPLELEYRIVFADSENKWILNKIIPEFQGDELVALKGVNIDITNSKKSILALKESEETFRAIFEEHTAIKLLINPSDGSIVNANKAAAIFYGWSTSELKKMKIHQINALNEKDLKLQSNGENHFEYQHFLSDGRIKDVEIYSSNVDVAGKNLTYCVVFDITDKKEAEKQLNLLSKSVEQSSVSIVITNADGIIEYVNKNFTEVTGYTASEAIGQNPRVLKSGEHPDDFYTEMWTSLLLGNTWTGEIQNKRKNGTLYWENAIISPITNTKGEITHFVAAKEELTEKKKLIKELIRAKEKAEENDRLKTAFLANLSHEVRTPMNGILGFSDLLRTPDLSSERQKEFINAIELSGIRMLNTITDMVEISKIETKQVKPEIRLFNLNQLIRELHATHKSEASLKNIEFTCSCELDDKISLLLSDERILTRILSNLINNAIKFTKQGSVSFGYRTHKSKIDFFVSDTGIGLTPKQEEIIFQKFMQADTSYVREYEGLGLGLSISMALAEILNGKISVKSTLGKGSIFTIELPLQTSKKINLKVV